MSDSAPFSPIAVVGTLALLAAYLTGAWCVAAGIAGNAMKSRRLVSSSVYGLYGFGALIALSAALLIYGFVTHDFAIKYVAATSETTMSTWYKVTAFWGGLDGSLLFWVFVLALFSTVAIAVNHRRHKDMIGFVVATIMVVQVFFLSLLIFTKNPFTTYLTAAPTEGQGLNPLLQNYWMVIHPPSLYTGFVAATIPFAFGIGALASGRLDDMWLSSVRVWMLICFFFLSFGLILGGRWAYEELGWGGYWAWDPVENAGLMPWFTATAFLHSAIIQEQRGQMKVWNLVLVTLTFFLTIFGTFMTRSGAVQSVHAFGEDNVLALQFIIFMAVILIVSIGLIVYRSSKLTTLGTFESFFSREFAFLLNNWILLACAFFVLFATMFPTISEALDGSRVSVGAEFFNRWMTPLGIVLLFLAGAAPLLAWRKTTTQRLLSQFLFPVAVSAAGTLLLVFAMPQVTHLSPIFADRLRLPVSLLVLSVIIFCGASISQEFFRGMMVRRRQTGSDPFTSMLGLMLSKRRKYGGYIIHLGVAVLFLGFVGKAYEQTVDKTIERPAIVRDEASATRVPKAQALAADVLPTGLEPYSFKFGEYVFVYQRLIVTSDDHKDATTAEVGIYLDGKKLSTVYPAKWDFHRGGEGPTTEVAITVRMSEDVYVVLTGYEQDTGVANFRVFINPLISWVWIGFLILFLGVIVCLLPASLATYVAARPPRTRLGRAADTGLVAALIIGASLAIASQAHAAPPTSGGPPAEHLPEAGGGMGQTGVGYAAMNKPINPTAESAMKDLLCPCNCSHRTILECDCGQAADLRGDINKMIAEHDTSTPEKAKQVYETVLATFVKQYGGEQVLANPRSSFPWLLPMLGALGGLGLIVVVGRRWIGRGAAKPVPMSHGAVDEDYVDKLDDELRDVD